MKADNGESISHRRFDAVDYSLRDYAKGGSAAVSVDRGDTGSSSTITREYM